MFNRQPETTQTKVQLVGSTPRGWPGCVGMGTTMWVGVDARRLTGTIRRAYRTGVVKVVTLSAKRFTGPITARRGGRLAIQAFRRESSRPKRPQHTAPLGHGPASETRSVSPHPHPADTVRWVPSPIQYSPEPISCIRQVGLSCRQ